MNKFSQRCKIHAVPKLEKMISQQELNTVLQYYSITGLAHILLMKEVLQ